ncbi:MAG: hypothetical protein PHI85_03620 [Victivallaceae bacterium]|nr:hypothetical protein [Victivallaceae bacterium]
MTIGCVFIVLFTFFYRSGIAGRELERAKKVTGCEFIPFTIESGVIYGHVRKLADGGTIEPPPGGGGKSAEEIMSLGMERFLACGIRLKRVFTGADAPSQWEAAPGETAFMRAQNLLWISLLPVTVFLILFASGCPWPLAMGGALLEAVSSGAMARYTGEDLVKGNFGFPLLALTLFFQLFYLRAPGKIKLAATMLFAYFAAANWDATQLFFGFWAAVELGRSLFGGASGGRARALSYAAILAGLLAAACFSPYGRAHSLAASPVIWVVFPAAIGFNLRRPASWKWRAALPLLLTGVWLLAVHGGGYMGNYSHFSSLLAAKLEFLNRRPVDPALLTFSQRYLWTPALQSSSWSDIRMMFPVALPLTVALLVFLAVRRRREFSGWNFAAMLVIYFLMFVLFYRFSVFAAYFMALTLPAALAVFWRNGSFKLRCGLLALLSVAVIWEGAARFSLRRSWNPALGTVAALVGYMRTLPTDGLTVLTNMDVGGALAGYCGVRLPVQPKFELPEARRITEEYTMLLFDPAPEKFFDWARSLGVRCFIYPVGTALWGPYSASYMADAKQIPPSSMAAIGEKGLPHPRLIELETPDAVKPFFRIYWITDGDDEFLAAFNAENALAAKSAYDFPAARRLAVDAYYLHPSADTYDAYCKVFATYPAPPSLEIYLKER